MPVLATTRGRKWWSVFPDGRERWDSSFIDDFNGWHQVEIPLLVIDPGLTVSVTGVTFTTGYGFQPAGGTLNNGDFTVDQVDVTGNTGDGCHQGFFGDGAVSLAFGGHDVGSDVSCNLTAAGDHPGTDPLLGPLADNGGPYTHALQPGSPPIDAGDAGLCPATDQHGVFRPRGSACDVGAFELD